MVRAIFTSLGLYSVLFYFYSFSLTCYVPTSVTESSEIEREREREKECKRAREFIDSTNCSDFPLLQDCPNSAHLFNDWQDQPFSFLGFFSFCPHILLLLLLLSSWTLSMHSSLPRCLKIGRHGKIHCPLRAFPFSFTVTSFAVDGPLASPVLQTEEGSPPEIWDSTILFHIARVCAPPRGITYEKHRNPPPRAQNVY